MTGRERKGFIPLLESGKALLQALSSIRLSMVLIFMICGVSLAGAVFPQCMSPESIHRFSDSSAGRAFGRLGLFDIHHSSLLCILAVLLCVNLTVCMAKRISGAAPIRITELRTAGSRRFWMLLMHAGVLIIIGAAAMDRYTGMEAHLRVPVGETTDRAFSDDGASGMSLGFAVRCDDFTIDYHENGMPSEYRTDLTFLEAGAVMRKETLRVNHPIRYQGMRFYQSGYCADRDALIEVVHGNGSERILAPAGSLHPIGDGNAIMRILSVEPDFMHLGPAVKLEITARDTGGELWVFARPEEIEETLPGLLKSVPLFDAARFPPYVFNCAGIRDRYVTVITICRNPVLPFLAAGAVLFLIPLFFVLIFRPGNGGLR